MILNDHAEVLFVGIERADDQVSIFQFITRTGNTRLGLFEEREISVPAIDAAVEKLTLAWPAERLPIKGWMALDSDTLPADRTFREAWRVEAFGIAIDLDAARVVQLDRIRQARAPALDRLDRDWMRAAGQKREAEAEAVEAERQRLRDLPATLAAELAAATTPEALAAIWPADLARPD